MERRSCMSVFSISLDEFRCLNVARRHGSDNRCWRWSSCPCRSLSRSNLSGTEPVPDSSIESRLRVEGAPQWSDGYGVARVMKPRDRAQTPASSMELLRIHRVPGFRSRHPCRGH